MSELSEAERLVEALAADRIKLGVDYAMICKYQQRCVFCCETFKPRIMALAAELGVQIDKFATFA